MGAGIDEMDIGVSPRQSRDFLKLVGKPEPADDGRPKCALWEDDDEWQEEDIPPRPWIARGYIMRRAVTILSGPGGGGKSSLTVAWTAALATHGIVGRFEAADMGSTYRQMVYNVEDDREEQRRRYSAALRSFGLEPRAIRGLITRCGPTDIGTLIHHDPLSGKFFFTDAWEALDQRIGELKPDVVWLDPLVELHDGEENNNTVLRHVVAHLRTLAVKHDCGIVLIHHARKGATAGDAEGVRGAGAIVGASRITVTVTPMTKEEAEELHIAADLRDLYFRVDGAKANYSRKGLANWHTFQEYELANGDLVAAAVAWTPNSPEKAAGAPPERLALIEAALARGTATGPYSPRLALDQPRSAAALFAQHGIEAAKAQREMLTKLLAGGWKVERFRDSDNDWRSGLRSPDGRPAARWSDAQQ